MFSLKATRKDVIFTPPNRSFRQTYRPKTSVDRIPLGEEFFRDGGKDHGVGDVAAGAL